MKPVAMRIDEVRTGAKGRVMTAAKADGGAADGPLAKVIGRTRTRAIFGWTAVVAMAPMLAACASGGSAGPPASPESPAETPVVPEPATATPATPGATPPATPETPNPDPEPATPTAIFTSDQAQRGRVTFDETCSACHTTAEFRGRSFQSNWGRRTAYSFFRTIRSTMPDDNPGGLEEQAYLDVVSYVLSINGHDAGSAELTADSPMREVRMAPTEPESPSRR